MARGDFDESSPGAILNDDEQRRRRSPYGRAASHERRERLATDVAGRPQAVTHRRERARRTCRGDQNNTPAWVRGSHIAGNSSQRHLRITRSRIRGPCGSSRAPSPNAMPTISSRLRRTRCTRCANTMGTTLEQTPACGSRRVRRVSLAFSAPSRTNADERTPSTMNLARLITRRSQVQILSPPPTKALVDRKICQGFFRSLGCGRPIQPG
jgi:hypothetical protein